MLILICGLTLSLPAATSSQDLSFSSGRSGQGLLQGGFSAAGVRRAWKTSEESTQEASIEIAVNSVASPVRRTADMGSDGRPHKASTKGQQLENLQSTFTPCSEKKCRRIAMLISGQHHRFMWQDAFKRAGGIRKLFGCHSDDCTIDVYIRLAKSNITSHPPQAVIPPYSQNYGLSVKSVTKHFQDLGANIVSMEVNPSDDPGITAWEKVVAKLASQAHNVDADAWWKQARTLSQFPRRWKSNGNMMLLRSQVYNDAIRAEARLPYKYHDFLYLREDNVFLGGNETKRPLQHSLQDNSEDNGTSDKPLVMVDEHCGYGYYSDKMYYLNPRAAEILFGFEGFGQQMLDWFEFAEARKNNTGEPMQSEAFLQHWMDTHHFDVRKVDFGRSDMRYVSTPNVRMCVPWTYWDCFLNKLRPGIQHCGRDHPPWHRRRAPAPAKLELGALHQ